MNIVASPAKSLTVYDVVSIPFFPASEQYEIVLKVTKPLEELSITFHFRPKGDYHNPVKTMTVGPEYIFHLVKE